MLWVEVGCVSHRSHDGRGEYLQTSKHQAIQRNSQPQNPHTHSPGTIQLASRILHQSSSQASALATAELAN